jgi:predicted transcriptional regulator
MAVDLLDQVNQIGSVKEPSASSNHPKNELERQVKRRFDSIGLKDQLWTKKTPFRVLARPESTDQELKTSFNTTITGIAKKLQGSDVVKKIHITYSISKIAQANPLVVVGRETLEKEIEGVPVVSIDNLTKLDKKRKAA